MRLDVSAPPEPPTDSEAWCIMVRGEPLIVWRGKDAWRAAARSCVETRSRVPVWRAAGCEGWTLRGVLSAHEGRAVAVYAA